MALKSHSQLAFTAWNFFVIQFFVFLHHLLFQLSPISLLDWAAMTINGLANVLDVHDKMWNLSQHQHGKKGEKAFAEQLEDPSEIKCDVFLFSPAFPSSDVHKKSFT